MILFSTKVFFVAIFLLIFGWNLLLISWFANKQRTLIFLWNIVGFLGARDVVRVIKKLKPKTYGKTLFHFEGKNNKGNDPCVGLTIDDCPGKDAGLFEEMLDILKANEVTATLFITSNYANTP